MLRVNRLSEASYLPCKAFEVSSTLSKRSAIPRRISMASHLREQAPAYGQATSERRSQSNGRLCRLKRAILFRSCVTVNWPLERPPLELTNEIGGIGVWERASTISMELFHATPYLLSTQALIEEGPGTAFFNASIILRKVGKFMDLRYSISPSKCGRSINFCDEHDAFLASGKPFPMSQLHGFSLCRISAQAPLRY